MRCLDPEDVVSLVTSYELATDCLAPPIERRHAMVAVDIIAGRAEQGGYAVELFLVATQLLVSARRYFEWEGDIGVAFRHPVAMAFDMRLQWFLRQAKFELYKASLAKPLARKAARK
jgi:hypothetical protein